MKDKIRLETANRELEDCKQQFGKFHKTYIEEYRMLQNKLNIAEAKLHEINEKCVTQANLQTFLETAAPM